MKKSSFDLFVEGFLTVAEGTIEVMIDEGQKLATHIVEEVEKIDDKDVEEFGKSIAPVVLRIFLTH